MTQALRYLEAGSPTVRPMPYWLTGSGEIVESSPDSAVTSSASNAGHVLDALIVVASPKNENLILINFANRTQVEAESPVISFVAPKSKFTKKMKIVFKGPGSFFTD